MRFAFCLLASIGCFASEVVISLKDAIYRDATIHTDQGGVVSYKNMRIQAKCITYYKNDQEERVEAGQNIMLIYGDKILVGKRLEYDFKTQSGILYDGLVTKQPWVIGGKKIYLLPKETYCVEHGFLTTCDTHEENLSIEAEKIRLRKDGILFARNISLRLFQTPLFTFPSLSSHIDSMTDLPFQFTVTGGGVEGSYATLRYRAITTDHLRAFLRADYVLGHGPGGGIDWNYCNQEELRSYIAKNFAVQDRSYDDPANRLRYRFEGHYHEQFCHNTVQARLTYDFLSDTEMASDFSAREFDLETGQNTQLVVNKYHPDYLADFITRVRVNDFQTVNQELPSFSIRLRPRSISSTNIISDTSLSAAYLNYVFASSTPNIQDFDSTRVQLSQLFYRPISLGPGCKLTPEIGGTLIHYNKDIHSASALQAVGYLGLLANTRLYQVFGRCKHVIEPYLYYQNFSSPTVSQTTVPMFSIQDGYSHLQLVRLGVTNSLFIKNSSGCIQRPFFLDLWAYGFYSIDTMEKRVPRIYGSMTWWPQDTLSCRILAGYNRETGSIDLFNMYYAWTVNENFAVGADLLSRGPRYWRKADYDNFMLDAFLSETTLENSLLSDRRDTFLLHLFYRFHPNWSFEARSRLGWHRPNQNNYFEYFVNLATVVGCNWHVKLCYEHREIDNRVFVTFRLGKEYTPSRLI